MRSSDYPQAYYVDNREGAGNDFETDPEPEHAFEILNWQLIRA
jgi:hypothetical protein